VSRFTVTGTAPDGTRLELPMAAIYGVTDGVIAEAHLFMDPATAVRRS
jgi:ketosteroid isomerase-like protein